MLHSMEISHFDLLKLTTDCASSSTSNILRALMPSVKESQLLIILDILGSYSLIVFNLSLHRLNSR